jgi:diguanylate cyclase (GGDEF)-like protein
MTVSIASPSPSATMPEQQGDSVMDDIKGLLENGFPLMKFPPALEEQFIADGADVRRRHFLISGLLALVVFNGFLIVDFLMARDVFWLALQLRLMVLTPLSLAVLYLVSIDNGRLLPKMHVNSVEVVILTSGLVAAASLAFILSETRSPFAHFYHVGFVVVIMYGNLVQRLRFWYAAVYSLALLGIHIVGVVVLNNFPERLMWPIVLLVTTTACFSLFANYAMERDERKGYLLTLRERGVVHDLKHAQEQLRELSQIDSLTGLYNRRHFQDYLHGVWERARYDNKVVSVLMVDVDHFKKYNDRYGHPAGDECLRQVALVLKNCMRRPGDVIARYGGEEFIAVLPETEATYALQVAERVRQSIESLQMRHESSSTALVVTVSVGVGTCQASFNTPETSLISAADQALYQAKHEGRNRVCAQAMQAHQA